MNSVIAYVLAHLIGFGVSMAVGGGTILYYHHKWYTAGYDRGAAEQLEKDKRRYTMMADAAKRALAIKADEARRSIEIQGREHAKELEQYDAVVAGLDKELATLRGKACWPADVAEKIGR